MLWAVWGTLALLVLVLAVGGVWLGRLGLATWRQAKDLGALLERGGDAISQRVDEATRKAEGSAVAVERLTAAVERLARSTAYARLLAGSAGSARAALTGLRGRLPRK